MTRQALIEMLATRIAAIVRPHPVRVAIDGVDAAGKSTLANELVPALSRLGRSVVRASVDDFANPASVRRRRGIASAEGYFRDSFDHEALTTRLLEPLGPGGSLVFRRSAFDIAADRPTDPTVERAARDAILVLDGVFLLRPELRAHFDFSVFLRAGFDVTVPRAERRDAHRFGSVDELRERYRLRYVPGQQLYLNEVRPEQHASMVVDNNDPMRPEVISG